MPYNNNRNHRDGKSKNFKNSSSPTSASGRDKSRDPRNTGASKDSSPYRKAKGDRDFKGFEKGSSYSDKKKPSFGSRDKDKAPFSARDNSAFGSKDKASFGGRDKNFKGKRTRNDEEKEQNYRRDSFKKKYDATGGKSSPTGRKRIANNDRPSKKANSSYKELQDDGLIRLNRYISNSGICSRRKADELIEAGVVSVNGVVVTELGVKVDPAKDDVRYNGERLKREKMVYILLNKPKDYITTTDDPQERRTVMHLIAKATRERVYPVGRLDRNTTGLLLLTNDGALAEKLSHPKNNITKIYNVELNKSLTQGDLNKISFGLELEDGFIKPDTVSYVQGGSKREVGVQIHSGKNRIVRRIFEHLGYDVVKLDRVIYANLTKKDLPRGRWRYLEEREVVQLKHFIK